MQITKERLKQIIREEMEVTLTNEEAGELFGEEVQQQLTEDEVNEDLSTGWLAQLLTTLCLLRTHCEDRCRDRLLYWS